MTDNHATGAQVIEQQAFAVRNSGVGTAAGSEKMAMGLALGVSVGAAALWLVALVLTTNVSYWLTPRPLPIRHPRLAALPAGPMLEAEAVSVGGEIFHESCTACHGLSGMGMAGAGKNLVYSDFVAGNDDNALAAFIKRGRDPADPANTTGIGMPPKGGNPTLTDQDLLDVVAFLRSLQDPRRVPEMNDNASASTGASTIKN